jgi:hypothetical protein
LWFFSKLIVYTKFSSSKRDLSLIVISILISLFLRFVFVSSDNLVKIMSFILGHKSKNENESN